MNVTFHVLSVVHPVEQLAEAIAFFEAALGMPLRSRGENWAVVDNGSVSVRLEQTQPGAQRAGPLTLELAVTDLDTARAALLEQPGVTLRSETLWKSADRHEVRLSLAASAHDLVLELVRTYHEDELGIVPELPTQLPWEERALKLVKTLLSHVPVTFRSSARTRVTKRAEFLTVECGEVEVNAFRGVQAVVQVTPAFQLDTLRGSLSTLGLDPEGWAADFEREPS